MQSDKKQVLAIAIDFGTTFSGLTYMRVGPNELLCHLNRWPGSPGINNKVPTIVSYEQRGGSWVPNAFGYAAENAPANQRCAMFKMCLDVEPEETACNPAFRPSWVDMGKTVTEVIKDFLDLLYNQMLSVLQSQGLGPENLDYNVLFTVPAQYELLEVERFRTIINSTGFGKHTIGVALREPEAAILYTTNHGEKFWMPENQCVILCDAGGGTVDIASYKISQLHPQPKLEQVDIVSGEPWGSIRIDRKFKSWFYEKCINEEWQSYFQTSPEGKMHLQRMLQRFIAQKEVFDNSPWSEHITIELSPQNLSGPRIPPGSGLLRISRSEMCGFFEESVSGSINCLDKHVKRCIEEGLPIKSIFLVGGLGSSPYLLSRVKEYTAGLAGDIQVFSPINAEYAVIRGAIESHQANLLGYEDQIATKLCPASYGIKANTIWDPVKNNEELDEQYINPLTKKLMAKNQVVWLIKKGEKITGKRLAELKEEFSRSFKKSPDAVWQDCILMCTLDDPPCRITEDVKQVCVLKSDMTGLPKDVFKKEKSAERGFFFRRKRFYSCQFDIVFSVGLTDMEFALWFKDKVRSDLLRISWTEL
ncbi:hypothetical protein TWF225_008149 [Orbilia oligospora]|uniref:Actin-like ATPase domain-containing protein n=2 Tax=Orbilia oligospora TaxID=2813651 RepID=A0A8H2E1L1_ORBOL|nr:hypothetical protein TWF225_008149 [Orbilia oligospora]KAF3261372.1 hypothetical protein TWF128_003140 [Orbilia oligospora]KAF3268856.1 hypothetical protein TWF217_010152 [Orbilia oligospora]KAF3293264.1 hypothetical protein TWF132_004907 [Orbilia oligospora]TGJ67794.1 hypothetical protein EYR41_006898 [Orbilia oligospora]